MWVSVAWCTLCRHLHRLCSRYHADADADTAQMATSLCKHSLLGQWWRVALDDASVCLFVLSCRPRRHCHDSALASLASLAIYTFAGTYNPHRAVSVCTASLSRYSLLSAAGAVVTSAIASRCCRQMCTIDIWQTDGRLITDAHCTAAVRYTICTAMCLSPHSFAISLPDVWLRIAACSATMHQSPQCLPPYRYQQRHGSTDQRGVW